MRSIVIFHFRRFLSLSIVYAIFMLGGWMTVPFQRFLIKYSAENILSLRIDYFGMDGKTIERVIVEPLKEVLLTVRGVEGISSVAEEGTARLLIRVADHENIKKIQANVKSLVDQVREGWPEDVQEPILSQNDPSDFPEIIVAFLVDSEEEMAYTRDWLERFLKPALENLDGVAECLVVGGREKEIQIRFFPELFWATKVQARDILGVVQSHNLSYFVGEKRKQGNVYPMYLEGKYQTLQDIKKLRIMTEFTNQPFLVELNQIAHVDFGLRRQDSFSRVHGRQNVSLYIQILGDADSVLVGEQIRQRLHELVKQDFAWDIVYDRTRDLQKALIEMWISIGISLLILIGMTYWIFRKWRIVSVIFLQIPCAFSCLFLVTFLFRIPIDTMMIAGMALGCGLLVDNGIVVSEHVLSLSHPLSLRVFFRGLRGVATALLASFLTTAAIFIPLLLMDRILFDAYFGFFVVITVMQGMALFFSLTFLPVLLLFLGKKGLLTHRYPSLYMTVFQHIRRGMRIVARKKVFVKGVLGVVLFLSGVGSILFLSRPPGMQFYREIFVSVDAPGGTLTKDINDILYQMEETLQKRPEVEKSIVRLEKKHGEIVIRLKNYVAEKKIKQLIGTYKEYWERFPVDIVFSYEREENKDALKLHFVGLNREVLKRVVYHYATLFFNTGLVDDIVFHFRDDQPLVTFEPDRERIQAMGISLEDVGRELHLRFSGGVATKYLYQGQKLYDIRIMDEKGSGVLPEFSDVMASFVRSAYNRVVSVGDVFTMRAEENFGTFYRYNTMRSLTMTVFGRDMGVEGLKNLLQSVISRHALPTGYMVFVDPSVEGVMRRKALLRFALLIAVWLTGVVLILVLGDWRKMLLCLSILPGAIIGVFVAQVIGKLGGSEPFLLGCILLAGIVVNNTALVFADENIRGYRFPYHWFSAGEKRIFPLLTTNLTTLLGIVPLFFTSGESRHLWTPLALTLGCGLIASLVFQMLFMVLFVHKQHRKKQDAVPSIHHFS